MKDKPRIEILTNPNARSEFMVFPKNKAELLVIPEDPMRADDEALTIIEYENVKPFEAEVHGGDAISRSITALYMHAPSMLMTLMWIRNTLKSSKEFKHITSAIDTVERRLFRTNREIALALAEIMPGQEEEEDEEYLPHTQRGNYPGKNNVLFFPLKDKEPTVKPIQAKPKYSDKTTIH